LQQFLSDAENALMQLELEDAGPSPGSRTTARRTGSASSQASDAQSEARVALDRAEMTTSAEEHKYAYDERKALEKPAGGCGCARRRCRR